MFAGGLIGSADRIGQHGRHRLVLLRHLGAFGHLVAHRLLSAVLIDRSAETLRRAEFHARRLSCLAVEVDTGGGRTRINLERPIRRELQLGEDRGVVEVAVVGMQQDVPGERASAEAGHFGVEFEALERDASAALGIWVRWTIDRRPSELMLDEEGAAECDLVGAALGAAEKTESPGGNRPSALGLAADAEGDDGFHPGHEIARPMPGWCDAIEASRGQRRRPLTPLCGGSNLGSALSHPADRRRWALSPSCSSPRHSAGINPGHRPHCRFETSAFSERGRHEASPATLDSRTAPGSS